MTDDHTIEYAITAIRRFLDERPDSADTLEGIHRWWIRWPHFEESAVVTLKALEQLEDMGEIHKLRLGTSILWRRRR